MWGAHGWAHASQSIRIATAALNVSEDQGSLPQGFFLRSRCPTPRGWKTWREGALEAAVGRARLSPTCTMLAIGF